MTSTRYLEDFEAGTVRELGSFTLTAKEIVAFAERYDPQPLHADPEAAEELAFGGLIASGWHTAARCMRLLVEGLLAEAASMGAVGLEELTWSAPVRPGEEVHVENEILEVRPSDSRDDRGYVRNRTVGRVDGEPVITWVGVNIIGRRDP
ncbi:MAG: MaoC family dehydratase [Halobacteriales archaeon]